MMANEAGGTNEHAPARIGERDHHSALLRKLTHDFADAIAVASGALDELHRDGRDLPSQMLALLERSVGRMARVARRMRLAALIDEDGLMINPMAIGVDRLVERAIAEVTHLDPRKTISIERTDPALRSRVDVWVDGDLAAAALGEHLANAIRFAHRHVRVVERHDETNAFVDIFDDGPGFDPEYVAAAVDRGWRQLSPRSALSLGLALELVDRMGGRTKIAAGASDRPPSGAHVSVILPRTLTAR